MEVSSIIQTWSLVTVGWYRGMPFQTGTPPGSCKPYPLLHHEYTLPPIHYLVHTNY